MGAPEDLILELRDPRVTLHEGERRVTATATLVYRPADYAAREVESRRYRFSAPLGPIELNELRWYLEEYASWPTGVFKQRAERIEAQLPQWGRALYKAALGVPAAQEALTAWRQAADGAERRFSVVVDSELPSGSSEEEQAAAREAASDLLSLPWEPLHDGRAYLFRGKGAVRVRRRLPNRQPQPVAPTKLPIRVLLVSPRPEDEHTRYFIHALTVYRTHDGQALLERRPVVFFVHGGAGSTATATGTSSSRTRSPAKWARSPL